MVLFKINGERNSGTNFLSKLLRINGFPVLPDKCQNEKMYYWKHRIPDSNVKNLNELVIDIFIFRNLEEWLVSMFNNPYHLEKFDCFNDFLIKPQKRTCDFPLDYLTNMPLNYDDDDKTIFNIRYYKFNKINEYKNNNKNVIFVNLSFLQNDYNVVIFLQELYKLFIENKIKNFIPSIKKHTKINMKIKNRKYNIDISNYQNIINKYKNNEIETFISNLKYEIY